MVQVKEVVGIAVSLLIAALLFPLALTAIQTYVPTDPTTLIVWPLIGIFAVIGLAIRYIPGGGDRT